MSFMCGISTRKESRNDRDNWNCYCAIEGFQTDLLAKVPTVGLHLQQFQDLTFLLILISKIHQILSHLILTDNYSSVLTQFGSNHSSELFSEAELLDALRDGRSHRPSAVRHLWKLHRFTSFHRSIVSLSFLPELQLFVGRNRTSLDEPHNQKQ